MDRVGLYFLELGSYYLPTMPFLVLLAVLALRSKEGRRFGMWYLHLPATLAAVLTIHWILFGLGPTYSIYLLVKSCLIDAVAHGVPLAVVLGTALFLKRKPHRVATICILLVSAGLASFLVAQILCIGLAYVIYS